MADPANVSWKRLVAPTFSSEHKRHFGSKLSGLQKEFLDAGLAVGQPMPYESQITAEGRIGCNRMMGFGIEPVIDGKADLGSEALIMSNDRGPAAIGEDCVVFGDEWAE